MSWFRNLIGKAEHVAAAVEMNIKSFDTAIDKKFAAFEADVARTIGSGTVAAGKSIEDLGLHIESQGHFDISGVGSATIKITASLVAPPPAQIVEAPSLDKEQYA